jgi:DNA-binding response OmpR family regulator
LPHRVLLVEDNLTTQKIVQATLAEKYEVACVTTLRDAEKHLRTQKPALLILDVNLPDGDGFEFCRRLRATPDFNLLPIIFLTGLIEVESRVHGLGIGGDDYITKPLEPKEFLARVQSHMQRVRRAEGKTSVLNDAYRIDATSQKVFTKAVSGEADLDLTPIEFKLLVHFFKNEGKVFSRAELIAKIWGTSTHVSEHTVDTHISTLRKKLGPAGQFLKAVVKRGYCFAPAIEKKS